MITLWVMNIMFTSFSIHWWHLSYLLLWWLPKGGFLTSSFLLHLLIDILSNGRAAPFLLFVYINTDSGIIILLMTYKPWYHYFDVHVAPYLTIETPSICLMCVWYVLILFSALIYFLAQLVDPGSSCIFPGVNHFSEEP